MLNIMSDPPFVVSHIDTQELNISLMPYRRVCVCARTVQDGAWSGVAGDVHRRGTPGVGSYGLRRD